MHIADIKVRRTVVLLGGAGRPRQRLWAHGYEYIAQRTGVSVQAVYRAAERGTLAMNDPVSVGAYITAALERRLRRAARAQASPASP